MDVDGDDSLLPYPGVAQDTEVEDLPVKKFFERHVQNVHPLLWRVGPSTG